jgi:hypothetical protein
LHAEASEGIYARPRHPQRATAAPGSVISAAGTRRTAKSIGERVTN